MAHEYVADIVWRRDPAVPFKNNRYSRAHEWRFDGLTIPGSAAPGIVPVPLAKPDAVDPEEAVVAAASACHMLFFLALAAKRFQIDAYSDHAVGIMSKNDNGKLFISEIRLAPQIVFSGEVMPTADDIAHLHHRAHEECYIANSLRADIIISGVDAHGAA